MLSKEYYVTELESCIHKLSNLHDKTDTVTLTRLSKNIQHFIDQIELAKKEEYISFLIDIEDHIKIERLLLKKENFINKNNNVLTGRLGVISYLRTKYNFELKDCLHYISKFFQDNIDILKEYIARECLYITKNILKNFVLNRIFELTKLDICTSEIIYNNHFTDLESIIKNWGKESKCTNRLSPLCLTNKCNCNKTYFF